MITTSAQRTTQADRKVVMDKIYKTDYWLVTISSAGCLPDNEPTYFWTKAEAEKYAKELWQEFIAYGVSEHNLYSVEVSLGEWV